MTKNQVGLRGGSVLRDDLNFLLARANALSLAAGNAKLTAFGLRGRSYSVLALTTGETRPTQRELAEILRLNPSQVVALVDELQAQGFVTREADPADRRTNVVAATPEGLAIFHRAQESVRAAERELHSEISPQQREQLLELLTLLAFPTRNEGGLPE